MLLATSHHETVVTPREAVAEDDLLAVVSDPEIAMRLQGGLRRIGAAPARAVPLEEAVARLVGPGRPPSVLLCEPQPGVQGWPALSAAASDPFNPIRTLFVDAALASDDDAFLAALRRITGREALSEVEEVEALRRGLAAGEVTLRYQPIVRMADRRPVGVEALVRWLRPGRSGATPVGPDAFMPMAERGGLALALSRAVGRLAAQEMRSLGPRAALPISINLPLEVLLRPDTAPWLGALCRAVRLRPSAMGIELTETTPVRDVPLLRRAVARLRRSGHPVWVDDMSLEERRDALLDLPFTGIKLDRLLVAAAPHQRRARAELGRLVGMAHRRGMLVTAEGIATPSLWRAMARAGVDHAQGFAVGRPLPAAAIPAWAAAWRAAPRAGRGDG